MDSDQDKQNSIRRFLEAIQNLRGQMNDEEFRELREWIEFIADKQQVSH